jgi:hemin uptake protein HemP
MGFALVDGTSTVPLSFPPMMHADSVERAPPEDSDPIVPDSIAAGDAVRTGSETTRPLVYSSVELFGGDREVWIEHRGELYRLRITASGKLYLTK